jgi:hypothetical protein
VYSPLVPTPEGGASGSISFVNEDLGLFWYQVEMSATPGLPRPPPPSPPPSCACYPQRSEASAGVRRGHVLLRSGHDTRTHTHTHTPADAIDMPLVHEKVGATCSTKVLVENPTDKPVAFTVSADNVSALPCQRRVQMHV